MVTSRSGCGESPVGIFRGSLASRAAGVRERAERWRHSDSMRRDDLEREATAAGRRIGKVTPRGRGETGCKTADAWAYIEKARRRRKPSPAR